MPTEQEKLARERMTANPFVPTSGQYDMRSAHAAEYIAFYLGEIEKHFGKISSSLEKTATNSELALTRLKEIAVVIQTKK
jgi:hypothetical protein